MTKLHLIFIRNFFFFFTIYNLSDEKLLQKIVILILLISTTQKNKCLGAEEGRLGMFTQLTMTPSLDRMVTNGRKFKKISNTISWPH